MNDLTLCENCFKVEHLARKLAEIRNNGKPGDLHVALYDIICYASKAKRRLNDLGVDDPLREPMGS